MIVYSTPSIRLVHLDERKLLAVLFNVPYLKCIYMYVRKAYKVYASDKGVDKFRVQPSFAILWQL